MLFNRIVSLVILALGVIAPVIACSPVGSQVFKPIGSKPMLHTDSKTGYVAHPPAPVIDSIAVHRGTGSDGASCADAGSLTLELSLPEESEFSLNELGFYFRVVEGENILAGHSVPFAPFSQEGKHGRFVLFWLDGAPSEQKPINLVVEAFALTNYLEIGPAVRFAVKSGVGR